MIFIDPLTADYADGLISHMPVIRSKRLVASFWLLRFPDDHAIARDGAMDNRAQTRMIPP